MTTPNGPLISTLILELAVWHAEGVRIVVRTPEDGQVHPWPYVRRSSGDVIVGRWLDARVRPLLCGAEVELVVPGVFRPNLGARTLEEVRRLTAGPDAE